MTNGGLIPKSIKRQMLTQVKINKNTICYL